MKDDRRLARPRPSWPWGSPCTRGERELPARRRVDLEVVRRPNLDSGLQRVPPARDRNVIYELVLLDRKLATFVRACANRRNARDCELRKRLVRHAAQAKPRRPRLAHSISLLVIDAVAVGIAHFVDDGRADHARVTDVEVVLVAQCGGVGFGSGDRKDAVKPRLSLL